MKKFLSFLNYACTPLMCGLAIYDYYYLSMHQALVTMLICTVFFVMDVICYIMVDKHE